MKLSLAAELAIRGACVLAERYGADPVKLDDVCAPRQLPRDYMAKIFGMLSRAGLVTPVRGKRGGYRLARDPNEVSILSVIEAVEGPLSMNFCQTDPPQCDVPDCPLQPVWAEIQEFVAKKLAGVTLGDCVQVKAK